MAYTYTRMGNQDTVTDALGTRTFTYRSSDLQLDKEDIVGATGMYSKTITRKYDTAVGAVGRATGFQVGTTSDLDADYDITYGYDALGRLDRVLGPGLDATYGAKYDRLANSDLVQYVKYQDASNNSLATAQRLFEGSRDLFDYVENKVGATTISNYDYTSDVIGRRTANVQTGTAFTGSGDDHHWDFAYDDRSELSAGNRRTGTTPGAGTDFQTNGLFEYDYDPIGNRTRHKVDSTSSQRWYCSNSLNEYQFMDDAQNTCPTPPSPTAAFTYDADGNLAESWYTYSWDAENRLVQVEYAAYDLDQMVKLQFTYDHMGRRVRKVAYLYDYKETEGYVGPILDQQYVYDGWNVVLVLDSLNSNTTKTKYTWGLDLSGQGGPAGASGIHGAGGISGLLAAEHPQTTGNPKKYWYLYDGNGNVGQLLRYWSNTSVTLAAAYQYDPYGQTLAAADKDANDSGAAATNPFRFSTKWLDDEQASEELSMYNGPIGATGLYYYGYRYYSPRLGRWMSRDPIEERGGLNLYQAMGNNSVTSLDMLGRFCLPLTEFCGNQRISGPFTISTFETPCAWMGAPCAVRVTLSAPCTEDCSCVECIGVISWTQPAASASRSVSLVGICAGPSRGGFNVGTCLYVAPPGFMNPRPVCR